MRFFAATNDKPLKRTIERDRRLGSWLKMKIEDGIAKRYWLDQEWREALRNYEAIPSLRSSDVPVDSGQPTIQVPVGAAMTDGIASAVYDLIFNTSPVFSVRGSLGYENHAHAFQLLADKLLEDDFVNFRAASGEMILDTVMLGTGAFYVIHAREVLKRATFEEVNTGPRVFSVPPEDLVVPGGTFPDIDDMQLLGYRNYFFESELVSAAKQNKWDISNFMVAGNVEWVRQRRIEAARTDVDLQIIGGIYEVFYVSCQYDYDEDGFAEDLAVVWDRTSYEIGDVRYAPYDSRPYIAARYQLRPHIFYGLGVMTMAKPFELEVTEWHNFKMKNAHLSNSRVWAFRLGALGIGEELKISPNKALGLADPVNDLVEKKMSDNYPTAQQYEAATIALAEMRVGTPASGAPPGIQSGKRVPAATAMALRQQQNRRFTQPFDNIRRAHGAAMTQCFMRLREQYRKGGEWRKSAEKYIGFMVGPKNLELIREVFEKSEATDMRDHLLVEVTATAQSINRQMDRQQAVERIQVMSAYYEKALALGQILVNPQTPQPLRKLAIDVTNGATESVRAFLRSFDDVRDADIFIPKSLRDLEAATKEMDEQHGTEPGQTPGGPAAPGGPGGQPGPAAPPGGVAGGAPATVPPALEGSSELGGGVKATGIAG